jgi:hypothetical protein
MDDEARPVHRIAALADDVPVDVDLHQVGG